MRRSRSWRALGVALVLTVAVSATAQRKPSDQAHKREIIRRYEGMLESNPEEGFALTKLLDILGSGPSLDEAIARYRQRVRAGTKGYASRMMLGHLLRAKKKHDEAIHWYREASKLKPREGAPYVSIARTLAQQKKEREALAEYEKAIRMIRDKSTRQRVIRRAVRLAVRLKDLKRAKELYQRVIRQDPTNVFLRVSYAELLEREKQYAAALAEWKALSGRFRGDPKMRLRAQVQIAELTAKLGKSDEALKLYRAALARIPSGNWLRRRVREKIIELYRSKNKLKELIALTLKERKTFDTLVQLAQLYEEVGDDKNAEKYYRLALRKNPRHLETHQALIKVLGRSGEKEKLFKAYADMARLTGSDWKADIKLAELYFLHGEKAKALQLLAKASKKHAREAQLHARIIDLYFQHGGTDTDVKKRIEAEYRILIRLEPKKTTHLVGLGEYYWTENDMNRAEIEWRKILKVVSDKADANFQLAQVFADHKMRSQAVRCFEEAVRLAPNQLKYRRGFAQELERGHRYDRAVEQWERVLKLSGAIKGAQRRLLVAAEARRRIIHLLAQQQMLRGRMVDFERRFKATPPDKNAGYLLGMGYAKYKEMSLAEGVFKRLLTLDPKDMTALVALQELYIQRNELEKAVAILERIAELDKSRAREIWQKIAVYLLNLNKKSDAVRYAKMAVEFDPSNPEANARLGKIYWQLGRVDAAIEAYKRAIRFNPRNFTFYFELARIYQAEQRTADELDLLQGVLREAKDHP
ncbi:MAG: tetratricopeptide repeat protein [Myxococcales bacterium]|nr:tetratricopeptide repeat protein [Myxococcales bacterium]